MACPIEIPKGFTRWKPRKQGNKCFKHPDIGWNTEVEVILGNGSRLTETVGYLASGVNNWSTEPYKQDRIYAYKVI